MLGMLPNALLRRKWFQLRLTSFDATGSILSAIRCDPHPDKVLSDIPYSDHAAGDALELAKKISTRLTLSVHQCEADAVPV